MLNFNKRNKNNLLIDNIFVNLLHFKYFFYLIVALELLEKIKNTISGNEISNNTLVDLENNNPDVEDLDLPEETNSRFLPLTEFETSTDIPNVSNNIQVNDLYVLLDLMNMNKSKQESTSASIGECSFDYCYYN